MNVDAIITDILKREGGGKYTDRLADAGGPTRWGITQRTLAGWRGRDVSAADVQALEEHEARAIYFAKYVTEPGFGDVLKIDGEIGIELIDSGVNCGQERASEWLQRCLNVLNKGAAHWSDIAVDGDVGPGTLTALRAFLKLRGAFGSVVLLRMLNSLQGAHYITLAERRPADEANVYGWFSQRIA